MASSFQEVALAVNNAEEFFAIASIQHQAFGLKGYQFSGFITFRDILLPCVLAIGLPSR